MRRRALIFKPSCRVSRAGCSFQIMAGQYQFRVYPLSGRDDVDHVIVQWRELENFAPKNIFLSSHWMSAWLDLVWASEKVYVLEAVRADVVCLLAFFVEQTALRSRFIPFNAWSLNESLAPHLDFTIEYNNFLVRQDAEEVIPQALQFLLGQVKGWDELVLPNVLADSPLSQLSAQLVHNYRTYDIRKTNTYSVDLKHFADADGYFGSLDKKTRYMIRRSWKELGCDCLQVQSAQSVAEAGEYLEGLRTFHARHWQQRDGSQGAFSHPQWICFHQRLIAECFDQGSVQMLRFTAKGRLVGFIYSLVMDGHVYMIQSGYDYALGENVTPGYLANYHAVAYNIALGNRIYDFLGGDSKYKSRLANTQAAMSSLAIRRLGWKCRLNDLLHRLVGRGKD